MGSPLRLLLVDDHEVVREGLVHALNGDDRFDVLAAVSSAKEALEAAHDLRPDAAIVDLRLPDATGEDLCRWLQAELPSIAVVILSSYLTEERVRSALRAGASAYVTKSAGLAELRSVLSSLPQDGGRADPGSAPQIIKRLEDLIAERAGDKMPTPQQARVLELAAEGLTYRDIAARLMISESTVRFHIQNLKIMVGVRSKTALVAESIRLGLIASIHDEALQDEES